MIDLIQTVRRRRPAMLTLGAGAAAALGIAACSADSVSTPPGSGTAQIAFDVAAPALGGASTATTTITVDGHTLSVAQLSFVISRAELSRSTAADSCVDNDGDNDNLGSTTGVSFDKGGSDNGGNSGNSGSGGNGSSRDCGEVRVGPDTVSLPLDGNLVSLPAGVIPAGTFDRVEFRVTRVILGGTFDTTQFTDTIAVNAKAEITLNPPLVVTDTSATSVTVNVPVLLWLQNPDGSLVNPATLAANPQLLATVRNRIMQSFRAFEDNNHDGRDDHDGGKH